jgi:hypothetical protein
LKEVPHASQRTIFVLIAQAHATTQGILYLLIGSECQKCLFVLGQTAIFSLIATSQLCACFPPALPSPSMMSTGHRSTHHSGGGFTETTSNDVPKLARMLRKTGKPSTFPLVFFTAASWAYAFFLNLVACSAAKDQPAPIQASKKTQKVSSKASVPDCGKHFLAHVTTVLISSSSQFQVQLQCLTVLVWYHQGLFKPLLI